MSGRAADLLLYGLLLVLPLTALIARRPPLGRMLLFAAAWIAIFLVGLLLAGQRDRLGSLRRDPATTGSETRIPMANDGHFWADVTIDGVHCRMLIDSRATTTAVPTAIARAAHLQSDSVFPMVISTANGQVAAQTATVAQVVVGGVRTGDLRVAIAPAFGNNDVLGMNFLSRLQAWRVESRTLILTPSQS